MSGSRPLAEVVTRSIVTGAAGFSCFSLSTSPLTRSISALLVGPKVRAHGIDGVVGDGRRLGRVLGIGPSVADGRPWKYLSLVNAWPISSSR